MKMVPRKTGCSYATGGHIVIIIIDLIVYEGAVYNLELSSI